MNGSSVVLIALLTSALTSAGTVYVIQRYKVLPSEPVAAEQVVVPELRGLSEADARKNAQAVQLSLLVAGREPSEQHEDGTVIRQSVAAGQKVPVQHSVNVVLARRIYKVPEVVGLSLEAATKTLEKEGYEVETDEAVPSADVEAGKIVEQTPKAGSELKRGASVSLKPSGGAAEVEVPKLLGMAYQDAKAAVEKLGLEPKFTWVDLAETASYRILRQTPKAGDKLKPGESVTLVVNR